MQRLRLYHPLIQADCLLIINSYDHLSAKIMMHSIVLELKYEACKDNWLDINRKSSSTSSRMAIKSSFHSSGSHHRKLKYKFAVKGSQDLNTGYTEH